MRLRRMILMNMKISRSFCWCTDIKKQHNNGKGLFDFHVKSNHKKLKFDPGEFCSMTKYIVFLVQFLNVCDV